MDYNCGSRSYDLPNGYNNLGTDFNIVPYPWNKMDKNEISVVAAAPGVITFKQDGNFDHSCVLSNKDWNAIYITHFDGSVAWYGYLKSGITSKPIGSIVEAGEWLGYVGSSGSSSSPHLHFEVYDSSNQLIDPFSGPCNYMTDKSWWRNQIPYYNPSLLKMHTGFAPPISGCDNETLNEASNFYSTDPTIFFVVWFRDQLSNLTATYSILTPSNTIWKSWTQK